MAAIDATPMVVLLLALGVARRFISYREVPMERHAPTTLCYLAALARHVLVCWRQCKSSSHRATCDRDEDVDSCEDKATSLQSKLPCGVSRMVRLARCSCHNALQTPAIANELMGYTELSA